MNYKFIGLLNIPQDCKSCGAGESAKELKNKKLQMIKNLKLFISLFLIMVLFQTCRKYPEGPIFSLRTSLNRLAGYYVLEKYIVNEIDSTDLIPLCNNVNSINYLGNDGQYYFEFDRHENIKGIDGTGQYIFPDHKNKIDIG